MLPSGINIYIIPLRLNFLTHINKIKLSKKDNEKLKKIKIKNMKKLLKKNSLENSKAIKCEY